MTTRRIVSVWFPRLASDRVLRACPVDAPFALTLKTNNDNRLYCLNDRAEQQGLYQGMAVSDARAFCPDLLSRPADCQSDLRFLHMLRRWATRYCPWVGLDGQDGLNLDVTGADHLFGGEDAMLADIRTRLTNAGLLVKAGLADTRGAAWALAHYAEGRASPGNMLAALSALPVEALRIDKDTDVALQRLGLQTVGDLAARPRAPLARRFGPGLLKRLDQALGAQPEEITPLDDSPNYSVCLTVPEPIGLVDDVMAGTSRLLQRLCATLKEQNTGARILRLTLRRVDMASQQIELQLVGGLNDPERILPLFTRGVSAIDSGYGIDQLRLEATQVEPLLPRQTNHDTGRKDKLDDLINQIGRRIGLENVKRILPADSHIPERSFIIAAAAYSKANGIWAGLGSRPVSLFPLEKITGVGPRPPGRFHWRNITLHCARAVGPERIAPEWWLDDENWCSGVRDYWKVQTRQGRRLWLYHTPQAPAWFVHGEFA